MKQAFDCVECLVANLWAKQFHNLALLFRVGSSTCLRVCKRTTKGKRRRCKSQTGSRLLRGWLFRPKLVVVSNNTTRSQSPRWPSLGSAPGRRRRWLRARPSVVRQPTLVAVCFLHPPHHHRNHHFYEMGQRIFWKWSYLPHLDRVLTSKMPSCRRSRQNGRWRGMSCQRSNCVSNTV